MSVAQVIVIKGTLTEVLPVERPLVGNPEGRIPSHCRSQGRRCVWYKPHCCPVEQKNMVNTVGLGAKIWKSDPISMCVARKYQLIVQC